MNNRIPALLIAALVSCLASPLSHAISIGFSPVNQSVYLGDNAYVDVVVSDFQADESLGDYDLNIRYDNAILDLTSIVFGSELGVSDQGFTDLGGGVFNLYELSWESPASLASQVDVFTLATLTFNTLTTGISSLDFSNIFSLGDQYGNWLSADQGSGSIEVKEKSVNVPEPGSLMLFTVGLLGLGLCRRKQLR